AASFGRTRIVVNRRRRLCAPSRLAKSSVRYRTMGVPWSMATPRNPSHPRYNRLLASLPDADYQVLASHLELMAMPLGLAVYESGDAQGFVYFPADSIVSLLYVLENGASTEIAVTGNEGLVGISLFMGGE